MSPARPRSEAAAKPSAAPSKIVLPEALSAEKHLAGVDADWAALVEKVGPFELPRPEAREPYEALVKAIAHQQLHGKAAQTILHRFSSLFPGDVFPSPERVLKLSEDSIRSCGFSASKTAAILDVCRKAVDGVVPSRAEAERLSDEELIARLTAVRGVGRWTVEMLLIFSLGRPDVLPVDDFGVREGFRLLKGLAAQPKPKALAEIGTDWAPFRSAAAWYLWRAADAHKALAAAKSAEAKAAARPKAKKASSKAEKAIPAAAEKKGAAPAPKKPSRKKLPKKT